MKSKLSKRAGSVREFASEQREMEANMHTVRLQTLMNLYGGGFRLFSCASFASRFILISLNRASASNRAEETKQHLNSYVETFI